MNAATLQRAMPGLERERAERFLEPLNKAMIEGDITTQRRCAAWLAQLGHESVSLRYMEEIADGSAYESRRDLGNTQPGDGRRYKGRGPIQLTGRSNYRAAGGALGLPLERRPELVATPAVGFRTAVWYWSTRDLNRYCDSGDFEGLTRAINGGLNGYADRKQRWARCKSLGAAILPAEDPFSYLADREGRLVRELAKIRAGAGRRGRWLDSERARVGSIKLYLRGKIGVLKRKRNPTVRERKRLGFLRDAVAGRKLEL